MAGRVSGHGRCGMAERAIASDAFAADGGVLRRDLGAALCRAGKPARAAAQRAVRQSALGAVRRTGLEAARR